MFMAMFLAGCQDKKSDKPPTNKEITTEVFASTMPPLNDLFHLRDLHNNPYTVTISNRKVTFKESTKAITLISFFATWCLPCLHEIPYLNDLHDRYKDDLLIASVLVHDPITDNHLQDFIDKHQIKYTLFNSIQNNDFASLIAKTLNLPSIYSIPLTVIYVEGNYLTHYEGNVPIEMIQYDIDQAIETLK